MLLTHFVCRLLHKVLCMWQLTASERAELHRRAGTLQGRVIARIRSQGLWSAFNTWWQVARKLRRIKLLVLRVTVRQLSWVLGAWQAAAGQLRGATVMVQRRRASLCMDLLWDWR